MFRQSIVRTTIPRGAPLRSACLQPTASAPPSNAFRFFLVKSSHCRCAKSSSRHFKRMARSALDCFVTICDSAEGEPASSCGLDHVSQIVHCIALNCSCRLQAWRERASCSHLVVVGKPLPDRVMRNLRRLVRPTSHATEHLVVPACLRSSDSDDGIAFHRRLNVAIFLLKICS